MDDRRAHPRLTIPLTALYRRQGESDWGTGRIANLSAGGAALKTSEELSEGTLLSGLRFQLPDGRDEPIQVVAVVLRSQAPGEGAAGESYLAGLHFLDLEGDRFERVRQFVFRGLRSEASA